MKKILLLIMLFTCLVSYGQITTTHNSQVKITDVPEVTTNVDSIVTIGADNKINKVKYSVLSAKIAADFSTTIASDQNYNGYGINTLRDLHFENGETIDWNTDYKTLNIPTGEGSILQVGQELYYRFHNATGSPITNGQVLQPSGTTAVGTETIPTVILAKADDQSTCNGLLMIATHDVANGAEGMATRFGRVNDINTSSWTSGGVYLSDVTAGLMTNTKPEFPSYSIILGGLIKLDASTGVIGITVGGRIEDTALNILDGSIRESIDLTISSNGTVISSSLERDGGGDLTLIFSDGLETFDTSPAVTTTLTAGTDTNPQLNYIYIPKSTKVVTVSTSGFPSTEHIKLANIYVQSAATTQTDDALINRNWNDHIKETDNNGHLLHISERLRQNHAQWDSGAEATSTVDSPTASNVYVSTTSGEVYQLHKQTFVALDSETGDEMHIVNHSTTPYIGVTNLNSQTLDALGVTLANKSFSFVLWGVANKTGETSHLMINLPTGSYAKNSPDNAVSDALSYSSYAIPPPFKGTGFLIARFTYTLTTNGTDWVLYNTEDLRGQVPNSSAGGGGGGGSGVSSFAALTDTPSSYVGEGGAAVMVNVGETALEFNTRPDFTDALYASGNSNEAWDGDLVATLQYLYDNYQGFTESGIAGEAINTGQVVYQAADDKWWLADADVLDHVSGRLALCTVTAIADAATGVTNQVAKGGSGWTPGDILYLSQAPGGITAVVPVTGYVRAIGSTISATTRYLYFGTPGYVAADGTNINGVALVSGGLNNVVEDTTPELGGDLDVLTRWITSSNSNQPASITLHDTGINFWTTSSIDLLNPDKFRISNGSIGDDRSIWQSAHSENGTGQLILEWEMDQNGGETGWKVFIGDYFEFNDSEIRGYRHEILTNVSASNGNVTSSNMGTLTDMTSATDREFTIPDTLTENEGAWFEVAVSGAGEITINTSGTATINGSAASTIILDGHTGTSTSRVRFVQLVAESDDWISETVNAQDGITQLSLGGTNNPLGIQNTFGPNAIISYNRAVPVLNSSQTLTLDNNWTGTMFINDETSLMTLTLPQGSTTTDGLWANGFQWSAGKVGTGNILIDPTGVTEINGSTASVTITTQWDGVVQLIYLGSDKWFLVGTL